MGETNGAQLGAADGLARATPESRGVSSRDIGRFLDKAQALGIELHGLMLYRGGAVIAEGWWAPYRADRPHMQHSLAKGFTATAVGLALAEGLFELDAPVVSFFPAAVPARPSRNLEAMTVRHLLTMRTGHAAGISGAAWRRLRTSWVRAFFEAPVPEPPGTRFVYNSAASYMLSAIVQRVSGQTLHEFLRPRFLDKTGSTGLSWESCPDGINPGGNGLSCRTAELVRLGAVHLRGGRWEGQQVLPAGWVRDATRPWVEDAAPDAHPDAEVHLGPPAPRGYGYHWWVGPDGAYYASGLFGQYAIVLPEADAVLACTAAMAPRDQRLLDLVWHELRPILGRPVVAQALLDEAGLQGRMARLALQLGLAGSPAFPRADGVSGRRFAVAPNVDGVRYVSFRFDGDSCVFALADKRGLHRVEVGLTRWAEGITSMPGAELHHHCQPRSLRVLARGGWDGDQCFRMCWVFVETAFRDEVVCRFTEDGITIDRSVNVNTGPLARPRLTGHLVG